MPANLTPQYLAAEEKYRQAQGGQEKLNALQEMLRHLPKHKGTEKIQAELKKKISDQKKSISKAQKSKKATPSYKVDSQGYPQIVVIGAPNSGRSKLISTLTNAELKVAEYPYTTRVPHPAMMKYENIRMQLVDTPPISDTYLENWLPGIIRGADVVLLVADLFNDDVLDATEVICERLEKQRIYLYKKNTDEQEGLEKKTLLVANKSDNPETEDIVELLDECYGKKFQRINVSSETGEGLDELKDKMFEALEIIRIYSKPPGKKVDKTDPIIIPKNSTVVDLADSIHHELAEKLKSAKIWGSKTYTDGQRIPLDYILNDEEIVELSTE